MFETDLLERAPLNGDTADDDLDRLILRGGNNRSWARNWNPDETTYVIDEFFQLPSTPLPVERDGQAAVSSAS